MSTSEPIESNATKAQQRRKTGLSQVVNHRVHPDYDDFTLMSDVTGMKINEPSSHLPVALNGDSDKPQELLW